MATLLLDDVRVITLRVYFLLSLVLASALAGAGCNNDNPTSPTTTDTTTPTATAASPSFSEDFVATVPVSGSVFYSFSVTQYGTVNAMLTDVAGAYVPSTVTLGFGLGVPSGETCALTSSITTARSQSPQLSATYEPGVYCVMISDVGNLFSPASVAVTVAYP